MYKIPTNKYIVYTYNIFLSSYFFKYFFMLIIDFFYKLKYNLSTQIHTNPHFQFYIFIINHTRLIPLPHLCKFRVKLIRQCEINNLSHLTMQNLQAAFEFTDNYA